MISTRIVSMIRIVLGMTGIYTVVAAPALIGLTMPWYSWYNETIAVPLQVFWIIALLYIVLGNPFQEART